MVIPWKVTAVKHGESQKVIEQESSRIKAVFRKLNLSVLSKYLLN